MLKVARPLETLLARKLATSVGLALVLLLYCTTPSQDFQRRKCFWYCNILTGNQIIQLN